LPFFRVLVAGFNTRNSLEKSAQTPKNSLEKSARTPKNSLEKSARYRCHFSQRECGVNDKKPNEQRIRSKLINLEDSYFSVFLTFGHA
jgi:hypothetical protein